MSVADIGIPLRDALLAAPAVTGQLAAYKGSFPIFTRRPVDPAAPYPLIVVSPDITKTDVDGINDQRPVIERDISVYGENDVPVKYRTVETIARAVHDLFHRNRHAIAVSGWAVVSITATGPIPAPVDDDKTVARVVSLTVMLAKQN